MKFDMTVPLIKTLLELRRIASAHVVDYRNLTEQELRDALIKVKPQYIHFDTVKENLTNVYYGLNCLNTRNLSMLIISDVLLHEEGFMLNARQTEEKVMAIQQKLINESNEIELSNFAAGPNSAQRLRDIELYYFVLETAWAYQDTKSPDEINLLRKMRKRLKINEWDHRVMEAKLGKFPKPNNKVNTRDEIDRVRRLLQERGLLFIIRDRHGVSFDVIPEELAVVIRQVLGVEMKNPNYSLLLNYKLVRKKKFYRQTLDRAEVGWNNTDTLEVLRQKIIHHVIPSTALGGITGKDGLSREELRDWCADLGIPVSGNKPEMVQRIITYYDSLQQVAIAADDEREALYDMFEALAMREYDLLRAHNIISRDSEVDLKFEKATAYLFEEKLNHAPLKQVGSSVADGVISFRNIYVMWDNKSKEKPGKVNLQAHIKQFHQYMESAEKPVAIFLVIAPDFTDDSEEEAFKYTSQYIGRNIVLITAQELKELGEEWSSVNNKRKEEPFPLGLLARTGRFDRKVLGAL